MKKLDIIVLRPIIADVAPIAVGVILATWLDIATAVRGNIMTIKKWSLEELSNFIRDRISK